MQHLSFLEAFLLLYSALLFIMVAVTLLMSWRWRSSLLFIISFGLCWMMAVAIAALEFLHQGAIPYHGMEVATAVLLIMFVAMGFHLQKTQPQFTIQSFDDRRSRW